MSMFTTIVVSGMALGRIALGIAPFVAAGPASRTLGFPASHDNATSRLMGRLFGVRDVGLGVLALWALQHPEALASSTVGDALRQWVRYLNLLDDAVLVTLELGDEHVYLQVKKESEAPAPAAHELCFALVALRMRQLAAAPFRVTAVELSHPAPADPAIYRAWFDAPVKFGAARTQLVLPRSCLSISLASADPTLLAILTRAADELTSHGPEDPTLTAQVARVLRDALREDEGRIEQVAKRLGLTARSLQRRLKDEIAPRPLEAARPTSATSAFARSG